MGIPAVNIGNRQKIESKVKWINVHTIIKNSYCYQKQINMKARTEKKFGDKNQLKNCKILNTVDLSIEKVLEKHFNYE